MNLFLLLLCLLRQFLRLLYPSYFSFVETREVVFSRCSVEEDFSGGFAHEDFAPFGWRGGARAGRHSEGLW
jgi:hypothetical protein